MKVVVLLLYSVFLCLCTSSLCAQKDLTYGVKGNIGLYGIHKSYHSVNKNKEAGTKNVYIVSPGFTYSMSALANTTFLRIGKVHLALEVGLGYNHSAFKKEWQNAYNFDPQTGNYINEARFIHDLKVHQMFFTFRGDLKYKKWISSLGWIHNRVISATNNRTRKFRIAPQFGGGWRNEESSWSSKEELGETHEYGKAYLSSRFSLQAVVGLAYEVSEHVILGSDFALDAMSGYLKVFQQGAQVQEYYYGGSGLSVFVVLK